MIRPSAALAGALITLVAPSLASADPALKTEFACTASGESSGISGTGFPADSILVMDLGGTSYSYDTDAVGSFSGSFTPYSEIFTPKSITLKVEDRYKQPGVSATTQVLVVKTGSNFPLNGKPSGVATWRFAGFWQGNSKPIYGHYRYMGRTLADFRFGKPSGPCGILKVKAKRLPVRPRPGSWTLQLDQKKKYSPTTKYYYSKAFTVF